MLLTRVDLLADGEQGRAADVRVQDGRVSEVGPPGSLAPRPGEQQVAGEGGALLPGLHDHHLHLLATAAAAESVDVGAGLQALAQAAGEGWVRAVGWSGDGDRRVLDAVVAHRPVRVQHRSGALWVLNSLAARLLDLDAQTGPEVEKDAEGRATGRLWRGDHLLSQLLPRVAPDLAGLGRRLAGLGLTGVTDATPDLDAATCALLRASVPQRLHLLGDPEGAAPVKLVLPDHDLPTLPALVGRVRAVRPRPVAVHCVSRVTLVLLLAALEEVGRLPGDRVEHGAVVPRALRHRLPPVVTQPGFLEARGDDYLRDLSPEDVEELYPFSSLQRAGVVVVPSSDAPYGPLDPWQVLRAARDRRSASGAVVGPGERVPVRRALDGLLRPLEDLTASPRAVLPGVPADLVLLARPVADVLAEPHAELVRATWVGGVCLAGELS